jgi:hypothetical protein
MLLFLDSVCSIYYIDRDVYVVSIQGMQCCFSVYANFATLFRLRTCICVRWRLFTIDVNNMPARHSTLGHTSYIVLLFLLFYITKYIPLFVFRPVNMPREFIELSGSKQV